jgi:hypothetical protein
MGMLVPKQDLGFGERSWRYSMLVRDGVIEKMFIEPDVPGAMAGGRIRESGLGSADSPWRIVGSRSAAGTIAKSAHGWGWFGPSARVKISQPLFPEHPVDRAADTPIETRVR